MQNPTLLWRRGFLIFNQRELLLKFKIILSLSFLLNSPMSSSSTMTQSELALLEVVVSAASGGMFEVPPNYQSVSISVDESHELARCGGSNLKVDINNYDISKFTYSMDCAFGYKIRGQGVATGTVHAYMATNRVEKDSNWIEKPSFKKNTRSLMGIRSSFIGDLPSPTYHKLTRPINEGTILLKSHFKPKRLIARGETVKVVFESGTLTLTSEAISMAFGYMGDRIKVKNAESGKVFFATVTDLNTVKID
nr:Flagella basal body P-ring formation protein FlgA [Vibrio chagasii]